MGAREAWRVLELQRSREDGRLRRLSRAAHRCPDSHSYLVAYRANDKGTWVTAKKGGGGGCQIL